MAPLILSTRFSLGLTYKMLLGFRLCINLTPKSRKYRNRGEIIEIVPAECLAERVFGCSLWGTDTRRGYGIQNEMAPSSSPLHQMLPRTDAQSDIRFQIMRYFSTTKLADKVSSGAKSCNKERRMEELRCKALFPKWEFRAASSEGVETGWETVEWACG